MRENYKTFFKELLLSVILSLYPVSYLYQVNSDKLLFKQTVLPFVIVGVTAFITFLLFRLLRFIKIQINNLYLLIPIICIILFFYGFFFNTLYNQYYLKDFIRNRYMLPLAFVAAILLTYCVSSIKNKIALRAIKSFLIVLNSLPYINLFLQTSKHQQTSKPQIEVNTVNNFNVNSKAPDIYYIILDMYPSREVLEKYWNFDNSKFLTDLTNMGFKVFPQSKSNYPITYLALNSLLNMQYIHKENEIEQQYLTKEYLSHTLAQNKVSIFLKNRGYNYYIFEGGIIPEVPNKGVKDFYLSPDIRPTIINYQITPDNDFFLLFINNSIIFPFADKIQSISSNIYRKRIYYVLDKMPELCKQRDKKFVIAHVMCPHSPFIFGENGEEVFVDEKGPFRKIAFIHQLKFINGQILPLVSKLINTDNGRDKIIILQGDHGSRELTPNGRYSTNEDWVKEYYGNFNAIYLSETTKTKSYNYVSPVNTFRYLFNQYFGSNYEILPSHSFYSNYKFPLVFKKIEQQ